MSSSSGRIDPELAEAEAAAQKLQDYYDMGLLKVSGRAPRHLRERLLLARYDTLNDDTRRRIRQFASPTRKGYTPAMLDHLLAQIRRHRYPMGFSLIARLLSVPPAQRRAVQEEAARGRWGRRALNDRIKALLGTRQPAGRRPRVAGSPESLAAALRGECVAWRRRAEALHEPGATALGALPEELRHRFDRASRAIKSLHDALDLYLDELRRGRR